MRPMMMTLAVAALALLPEAVLAAPPTGTPTGIWTNPQKSVRVVFQKCSRAMCGKIVWASPKAQSDAERGGGGPLVGTMLFSDFVEQRRGLWNGSVLIPDIGQTVTGTIEQTGPDTLVGEGCLLAGFGCKRQTWTRTR